VQWAPFYVQAPRGLKNRRLIKEKSPKKHVFPCFACITFSVPLPFLRKRRWSDALQNRMDGASALLQIKDCFRSSGASALLQIKDCFRLSGASAPCLAHF